MKRIYKKPFIEVSKMDTEVEILAGSGITEGTNAPVEGTINSSNGIAAKQSLGISKPLKKVY